MRLAFAAATPLRARARSIAGGSEDGRVVLAVDDRNVGRFARIDDGSPLAAGELAIRYRIRRGDVRFGTNAWFFEEGTAARFETAKFGEFRVAADGDALLAGLRDAQLLPLGSEPAAAR